MFIAWRFILITSLGDQTLIIWRKFTACAVRISVFISSGAASGGGRGAVAPYDFFFFFGLVWFGINNSPSPLWIMIILPLPQLFFQGGKKKFSPLTDFFSELAPHRAFCPPPPPLYQTHWRRPASHANISKLLSKFWQGIPFKQLQAVLADQINFTHFCIILILLLTCDHTACRYMRRCR